MHITFILRNIVKCRINVALSSQGLDFLVKNGSGISKNWVWNFILKKLWEPCTGVGVLSANRAIHRGGTCWKNPWILEWNRNWTHTEQYFILEKKTTWCDQIRWTFQGTPSDVVVSSKCTWYADVMILFEGDHWNYFGQCIYTSGRNITCKVPNKKLINSSFQQY